MSTTTSPAAIPASQAKPRSRGRLWLRRGIFGFALTLLGFSAVGAVYQAIATGIDRRTYSPPGQLVDIGGRSIHMVVMGEGTGGPTVILEAGMATFSSNYSWIQNELAATTRVVAYDRAGLGWSDPSAEPQDAQQSARDLHAALQNAGIQPPYVVAGHSYGGLVVRAFTDLYPEEVAGMVLIDASHPDQWSRIPASRDGKLNGRGNLITGFLARFGVVRIFRLFSSVYDGLPEQPAAEMRAIMARPETWQNSGEVMLIWNERSRPQVNQARSLGDLPLAVLSVTEQPNFVADLMTRLQNELTTLSRESIHYTVEGATHEGLVAKHEHAMVVAETILQVLESASTGRPLDEVTQAGE